MLLTLIAMRDSPGMAISMTLIEYIGGLLLLKGAKIRLWD